MNAIDEGALYLVCSYSMKDFRKVFSNEKDGYEYAEKMAEKYPQHEFDLFKLVLSVKAVNVETAVSRPRA